MKSEVKTIEHDYEFLKKKSEDVDFSKDDVNEIVGVLEDYCTNNLVFAMAANQLGFLKRVMFIKHADEEVANQEDITRNDRIIMINPVIKQATGSTLYWEACVSCKNLAGLVNRAYQLTIAYYDEFGKMQETVFEGLKATVFQHEYDHLDGILHIEIAREVRELTVEERKVLREKEPYKIVSKEGPFERNVE